MATVIAMALCAALFVVFTVFRPKRECTGNCGSCVGSCALADSAAEGEESHV